MTVFETVPFRGTSGIGRYFVSAMPQNMCMDVNCHHELFGRDHQPGETRPLAVVSKKVDPLSRVIAGFSNVLCR
jgi:hypothetical protein